jgi:peptidyl-prolyl cis-trans isomerase A (cyclophilin A)
MDVVDKIAALPTRALGPFAGDVPNPLVLIESAHVIGEETPAAADSAAAPAKAKPTMPVKPAARKTGKAARPANKD